ncbi:hypothetical protein RRG08_041485 [Elysia crispata]|uniref:Uncharacterized protein n=1 Tax=Elysia crispata TaxID=231223 RepID=A0AAE0Y2H9_9GAST|nr:hypothetical protein RRG08_041485 [Elysia crispata]
MSQLRDTNELDSQVSLVNTSGIFCMSNPVAVVAHYMLMFQILMNMQLPILKFPCTPAKLDEKLSRDPKLGRGEVGGEVEGVVLWVGEETAERSRRQNTRHETRTVLGRAGTQDKRVMFLEESLASQTGYESAYDVPKVKNLPLRTP